jgi:hypothetical protein
MDKTPSFSNFRVSWSRRASEGTTTSSRSGRTAMSAATIVSVLPVPVGMTIVAGSFGSVVQYPRSECTAPTWGRRNPAESAPSSNKGKRAGQLSRTLVGESGATSASKPVSPGTYWRARHFGPTCSCEYASPSSGSLSSGCNGPPPTKSTSHISPGQRGWLIATNFCRASRGFRPQSRTSDHLFDHHQAPLVVGANVEYLP